MTTARTVVWQAIQWTGLEYFILTPAEGGLLADGQLIGMYEGRPYSLHYQIRIDNRWAVREVIIRSDAANDVLIQLTTNGRGEWYDREGNLLPELAGCIDVDLTLSPFTNTLPIRRLRFLSEQPQQINVVYIDLPAGKISSVSQLYIRLTDDCYRFQQPDSSFSADLPVDADKMVIDYPNLFRRVSSG
ncbi:putative glycolipid-binding domain-containing protein [Spirosoma validum]|uniref:Glycolipid-binding domain-containing protein n=1 Tax=Spirosoma validum TaxID=2771355 RepID=A0A927B7M8_9BACT|nr:putative glycolipid-binding domain-containing protein [Spirosoma validum]MBD2756657.1 putative glycolipid-binding domain-containing protein [Spirosoma validum]